MRSFVVGWAAAVLFSTTLQAATVRISLRDFVSDPARVAALRHGVEVMKARKPSDPKSWFYQSAIHGVTPEAVSAAEAQDPDVAFVDQARFWNQCPHFGQSSADFLIWHRAYLKHFERILREASGDSSFTLPYWDYSGSDRTFPRVFGDPQPDSSTGLPTNPLFEGERELAFVFGMYNLSDRAVSTAAVFRETDFFGADEETGLAGGLGDTDPGTQGVIEGQPHNLIHFAVGGAIGAVGGSMASVTTAAFDPIFWVHHANIDRLWAKWECEPNRSWGMVPAKMWLDERPWSFNDVDGSIQSPSRAELLDYAGVGISYDSDDPSCNRLSANPPQPAPPQEAVAAFRESSRLEMGRIESSTDLDAERLVTRMLQLIPSAPAALGHESMREMLAAPHAGRVLLSLGGIRFETPPSVGFDVFVDAGAGEPVLSEATRVGTLNLFTGTHAHGDSAGSRQVFDITETIERLGGDPARLRVSIVPFDLLVPRLPTLPVLRRSGDVEVGSMSVLVEQPVTGGGH